MAFFFNHQQRQAEMSEIFYRYIMALEKHSAMPSICVYTMGFAFQIESPWPSNSANMIRYTSSTSRIVLQPYLGQDDADPITVWVFQTNWMILKTNDGVAIPIFNNSVSLASAHA